ncbi:MAG: hypothetical protein IID40_07460, partial [Planctomycetes bacterium]|nr:hypothetical protein [Planctomycetota bacterium]
MRSVLVCSAVIIGASVLPPGIVTRGQQTPARGTDLEAVEPEQEAPRQWLVPGPPPPPKQPGWFHLDGLGGYLDLDARYEQQRRRRRTSATGFLGLFRPRHRQRNIDSRFRERLGLEISGD